MSAAASQMEINNPTSGNSKQKHIVGGSTMLQSMNDVSGSIANMSADGESENGYGTSFNKSTYMDDYIMACDTKPNSNSNLGSNTNMSTLGNSNTNISMNCRNGIRKTLLGNMIIRVPNSVFVFKYQA